MASRILRWTSIVLALVSASFVVPAPSALAQEEWRYPQLHLVVARHDGKTFVGAQAWMSDGCESLIGSTEGHHVRVRGVNSYVPEGYGCTTSIEPDWQAARFRHGWSILRVTYKGMTGRYSVRVRPGKVRIQFLRGENISPPKTERWWRVPDDVLIAHVWYGRAEAIERVSDDVDRRLRNKGATTFHTPEGWVLAPGGARSAPGTRGKDLAHELAEELKRDFRRRVYLTDLSRRELRRIARRAAQTERCTYVSLYREPLGTGGVTGRPPCAN